MTPKVAATGTSFKGAAQYYLHDKRAAGEAVRLTAERVSWTETRNLMADDPEIAWRIMAATSKDQARIKMQAGIKATGAQSAQHVYAYSLSWHPEEAARLSREDMVRAADETLKVLGAEKHQALIVAHRDTAHPHVHVILNRVSPIDGRLLSLRDDHKKLSAWALRHEQDRGKIYCAERERRAANEPKRERANDNDRSAPDRFADRAAALAKASASMHARHRAEGRALETMEKERRAAIYDRTQRAIQDAVADNKFRFRPKWSALGRRHAQQNREFRRGEQSILGVISNAWKAMRVRDRAGYADGAGGIRTAVRFIMEPAVRRAVLTGLQDRERALLSAQQKADLDGAIRNLKGSRGFELKALKAEIAVLRAEQITRHAREKDQQREGWRELSRQRQAAGMASARHGKGRHKPPAPAPVRPPSLTLAESFGIVVPPAAPAVSRAPAAPRPRPHAPAPAPAPPRAAMQEAPPRAEGVYETDWRKSLEATRQRRAERSEDGRTRPRSRARTRRRDFDPE